MSHPHGSLAPHSSPGGPRQHPFTNSKGRNFKAWDTRAGGRTTIGRRLMTNHLSYWESTVSKPWVLVTLTSNFRIEETQQALKALCWNHLLHICLFTCNCPWQMTETNMDYAARFFILFGGVFPSCHHLPLWRQNPEVTVLDQANYLWDTTGLSWREAIIPCLLSKCRGVSSVSWSDIQVFNRLGFGFELYALIDLDALGKTHYYYNLLLLLL